MEINQNMMVSDFLRKDPKLAKVFINFGLPYRVCEEPFWDTVKELSKKRDAENGILVEELSNKDTKTI